MPILTAHVSCGNICLLGGGAMATEPHSNSSLQQNQLPKKETNPPTQPGAGNSAEMSLVYERSELQVWMAEELLCRLEWMDRNTPCCLRKTGMDLVFYPYIAFSRHECVVCDVNGVEASIWKQIKQNLTSADSLQAK